MIKSGEIVFYKDDSGGARNVESGNDILVNGIPLSYDGSPALDEVAKACRDIYNKCVAIDDIFDSIQNDLDVIENKATDDNAAKIASALKIAFKKIQSDYYWKTVEAENENESWFAYAPVELLFRLETEGKETLVIPSIRKALQDVMEEDYSEQAFAEQIEWLEGNFKIGLNEEEDYF